MELSREDIKRIAEASADKIIKEFHFPESIAHGLAQSMGEEFAAVRYYERRSNDAMNQVPPDYMTAMLYIDIAGEEAGHFMEFSKKLRELSGK